ncbi:hypothetical protein [Lederbergia graminis]|uniref:Uncharacterized protein n=1 Tax=Lederbergia graminis TaxID=735518 RepID=A0ABW0LFM4_9BACI
MIKARLADELLLNRGVYLRDKGYKIDHHKIEYTQNRNFVFYHYTREERLDQVLNDGLYAYRPVACPKPPEEFKDCYLVEGFLEPFPRWLKDHIYFGDLGMELVKQYVGNVLLRIEIPVEFANDYIADYAHILECKHLGMKGTSPLQLGYDCSTGYETTQGYVNSYIEVKDYKGGHIAPVVQFLRKHQGVTVPSKYINISEIQPFI